MSWVSNVDYKIRENNLNISDNTNRLNQLLNQFNDTTDKNDNSRLQGRLLSKRDPSISLGEMKNIVGYINPHTGTVQYYLDDTTVPFEVYPVSLTLLGESAIYSSNGLVSDFRYLVNSDTLETNANGNVTKKIQVPLFFKVSFNGGKFFSNNRINGVNYSILMNKNDVLTNPNITVSPLSNLVSCLTLKILTQLTTNESYPFTNSYSTALNIIKTYINNTLTSDDSNNFSNIDYISTENSNLMVLNYLILNNVYTISNITSLDKNTIFDKIAQYFLNMHNNNSTDGGKKINKNLFFEKDQLTSLISYCNNNDTQINSNYINDLIKYNTIIYNNALPTFNQNVSSNQNILSMSEILYRYIVKCYNVDQLVSDGYTLPEIKKSGIHVHFFNDAGYTLQQLINDVGYTAQDLKLLKTPENRNRFTNEEIITSGLFTVDELKDTFTIQEISSANHHNYHKFFTVNDIILGGYSVYELKTAGYTAKQIYDSENPINKFTLENMYTGGFTDAIELYTAGYSALDIYNYWNDKNVSPPLSDTTVLSNILSNPIEKGSNVYMRRVNGRYHELGARANTFYKKNIPIESTNITYVQNIDNVMTTVSINEINLSEIFTVVYSFVDEIGRTTTTSINIVLDMNHHCVQ